MAIELFEISGTLEGTIALSGKLGPLTLEGYCAAVESLSGVCGVMEIVATVEPTETIEGHVE